MVGAEHARERDGHPMTDPIWAHFIVDDLSTSPAWQACAAPPRYGPPRRAGCCVTATLPSMVQAFMRSKKALILSSRLAEQCDITSRSSAWAHIRLGRRCGARRSELRCGVAWLHAQ
jgi:hypothetical protein